MPVFQARMRVVLLCAVLLLVTAAVPLMPTAIWAAAAICFSFFWVTAMSTNIYVMPIDFFAPGASRVRRGRADSCVRCHAGLRLACHWEAD